MRIFDHLRLAALRAAGLAPPPSVGEILEENWCGRFVELMQNRMVFGRFRYGPLRGHVAKYDNVSSAIERLCRYRVDGNLEHLVDVANLCLIEFVRGPLGYGSHPNPKWNPIDDGAHTPELCPTPRDSA